MTKRRRETRDERGMRAMWANKGAECGCARPAAPFYPSFRHRGEITVETQNCQRCDGFVPLGPATDTPATAIEVRAAEIASALRVTHRGWPSGEYEWPEGIAGTEPHGWLGHARDDDPIEPGPAYWSGYLARCISTHPTGDEHE